MSGGGSCPGATPITSRQGPSLPGSRCGRGTRAVCSLPPGETAHLPAALSTHSLSRALGQDGAGVCGLQCLRASGPAGAPAGASRDATGSPQKQASCCTMAASGRETKHHLVQSRQGRAEAPCTVSTCSSGDAPLDKTPRHSCLPVCAWP